MGVKIFRVYRYEIRGSKTFSNLFWFLFLLFGSSYFFWISYTSYVSSFDNISFFPQGLVMGFYSIFGFLISLYLFLSFLLDIGYGFNEFNQKERIIRLFRWGFPGKDRRIESCYSFEDLKMVKISLNSNEIFVSLKGDLDIPLTRSGFFQTSKILEQQATDIAQVLGIPLIYI